MFDELYQQLLLEHAKNPHNRGRLEGEVAHISLLNPLCGDEISLWLRLEEGSVAEVKFDGKGCFISQAAASMLTENIKGASVEEVGRRIQRFRRVMYGEELPDTASDLGDLMALEGVKRFPLRIKCALLAFEALEKAVKKGW